MSVFVWVPGQIPPDRFNSAVAVSVSNGTLTVLGVGAPVLADALSVGGAGGTALPGREPVFSYPEGTWTRAQYPGPDGETIEIQPRPVAPQVRRRARGRPA